MARTKNTFRNLIWAFAAELIILGLGLVMPRLIILTYGSSVNGLTATINQILSVLNLLQAGAVGASIFAMFKPVAENNNKQISLILHSSKHYFNRLGWIFLVLTLLIAPIIAQEKSGNDISFLEIVFAFSILGINSSLSFFFFSSFDIFFSSHQKRYILSISGILEKIIYYGLLFIIISYRIHFLYMYVAVLIGSLIKVGILYLIFRTNYSHKIIKIAKAEAYRIPNRGYLLINQISTQAVESSPTIFIAFNYSFSLASVYSIYYIVMAMIKMVINTVQISVSEVFGNMVVTEDSKRIEGVFNLMQFIYTITGTFLCTCTAFLFMPFISLYTSGMTDVNYIVPLLALFIVIYCLIYCFYMPYYTLTNVLGLYKETFLQSLLFGLISLIASFILTKKTDMSFVLIGLIFYYLSSMIYRIVILRKRVKWFSIKKLHSRLILNISLPVIAYFIQQELFNQPSKWFIGLYLALAIIVGALLVLLIYIVSFERKEFLECREYFNLVLNSKLKR